MNENLRIECHRSTGGFKASGKLPDRLRILEWGANPNANGSPVLVDELSASVIPTVQHKRGYDRVALDWEHNTVPGTPAHKETKEPRSVAAYGDVRVIPGDGIWLENLTYTPDGVMGAANKHDVSPAIERDAAGRCTFVHSAALCTNGAIYGLEFYAVSINPQQEEQTMSAPWIQYLIDKKIIATEADLGPLMEKCLGEATAATEGMAAATAKLGELVPKVEALAAAKPAEGVKPEAMATLVTRLDALSAEMVKRDKAELLAGALREGKVVALSASAVDALSVADLKAHVEALAVTVPLEARTAANTKPPATAPAAVSDLQKTIALNCGLDPAVVYAPGK